MVFPVLECIHIFGFILLFGAIALVDFRLLFSVLPDESPGELEQASNPWSLIGLALALPVGRPAVRLRPRSLLPESRLPVQDGCSDRSAGNSAHPREEAIAKKAVVKKTIAKETNVDTATQPGAAPGFGSFAAPAFAGPMGLGDRRRNFHRLCERSRIAMPPVLAFAQWIQSTVIPSALRISSYVYPIVLSTHLIGIAFFGA